MKILCWTVGKQHESYVKDGIELFTKRTAHYFPIEWSIFPNAKSVISEEQVKKQEATAILKNLQVDDILVALDEKGKQFSSPELADYIIQKSNESKKRLIFLIGGAYGLDREILNRANFTWSLSRLVFPHQLVRLILAEQLYRACTIIRNEKYHHS